MGRVRTNLIKKASRVIIERFFSRLTLDFDTNKKIVDEVAKLPSKRVRNKIAGFTTHLMKRIQRGPVRGISLKLQEEERERRMDFVPERSVLDVDKVPVEEDTLNLLRSLEFGNMVGIELTNNPELLVRPTRPQARQGQQVQKKRREPRELREPRGDAGGAGTGLQSSTRDSRNNRRNRKPVATDPAAAPVDETQSQPDAQAS